MKVWRIYFGDSMEMEWKVILLSSQCRSLACAYMWVNGLDHRA